MGQAMPPLQKKLPLPGGSEPLLRGSFGRLIPNTWFLMTAAIFSFFASLFLCRKLHLLLGKSTKTAATTAALFDSNMYKIISLPSFAPETTGGAYSQRSPRPHSCILGAYF